LCEGRSDLDSRWVRYERFQRRADCKDATGRGVYLLLVSDRRDEGWLARRRLSKPHLDRGDLGVPSGFVADVNQVDDGLAVLPLPVSKFDAGAPGILMSPVIRGPSV
jgi:hypothetical protein